MKVKVCFPHLPAGTPTTPGLQVCVLLIFKVNSFISLCILCFSFFFHKCAFLFLFP